MIDRREFLAGIVAGIVAKALPVTGLSMVAVDIETHDFRPFPGPQTEMFDDITITGSSNGMDGTYRVVSITNGSMGVRRTLGRLGARSVTEGTFNVPGVLSDVKWFP